jgi:cyclic pyranopterin phosphate synthase
MPKEIFGSGYKYLSKDELFTFEEITRVVKIFTRFGLRKIRLTGGEPLLRRELEELVRQLREIGDLEIALTTNGVLLPQKAQLLKDAGLDRLTVSLDSLNDDVFMKINDVNIPVEKVLMGIRAAEKADFTEIKINMVVKRGVNEADVLPMADYFRGTGHILRFIEYMDVGNSNDWRMEDVYSAKEIITDINAAYPVEAVDPNYRGEVANRWEYQDGGGEIGVIASVTQPFCGDCTRLRLSARGQLFTCLFSAQGHDLREIVRSEKSDEEIYEEIVNIWTYRNDRYSEIRSSNTISLPKVEMSYIGG